MNEAQAIRLCLQYRDPVGVRFTTSVIMGGAAELLAYGTAVMIEDQKDS